MKNHCENPGYDVTQGEVICHDSGTFNQIVGEALKDLIDYDGEDERKIWLSTVDVKDKPVQIQLVITRDLFSFIDEN